MSARMYLPTAPPVLVKDVLRDVAGQGPPLAGNLKRICAEEGVELPHGCLVSERGQGAIRAITKFGVFSKLEVQSFKRNSRLPHPATRTAFNAASHIAEAHAYEDCR